MQPTTEYGSLITLVFGIAVIIMVMAAFCFPLPTIADHEIPQTPNPTITPLPEQSQVSEFGEKVKANVLSLALLLGGIVTIFAAIGKVFKPAKLWFVGWIRKSLHIVDANKTIDERFASIERRVAEDSQIRQKEYAVMTGQNESIELGLSAVLRSVEDISRRLGDFEDSNLALMRDTITKTFYKYCKRQAIPIHEKENMSRMYDIYRRFNGNSYICALKEAMDEWEVLSGEDAPSCRPK